MGAAGEGSTGTPAPAAPGPSALPVLPQVPLGSSLGGPYLAVHLRRKDFIWGHREDVPSLDGAVRKIRSLMKTHRLDKVFVATDAVRTGRPARLCPTGSPRPLAPVP